MNWKKITLASGVALALVSIPLTTAQARGGRGSSAPSARVSSGAHVNRSFNGGSRFNGRFNNGRFNSGRFNNGRWADGRWHHHHHRYPRFYYSGFYPYGFGYPFGYGYGYGYPYWGTGVYYSGGSRVYNGRNSVAAQLQQELARGGYYRGSIDGVIGNGTRRAIRAYERDNGLPVDGLIDQQLLETMGLS